ncbi:hypothetical protein GCM10023147_31110 [Tsukamurella soli]|uniref:HTH tetR-type domain-containing protein n=1 Tax=Tsukamurella soli TaxID=644556 RepID=A0ABP8JW63_9ACTN
MPTTPYHRGDLPDALIRAAIELLDTGDGGTSLSLRAAARRAGVSPAAPYRHFSDRTALVSAVATIGYRQLIAAPTDAHPTPRTLDDLAAIAVTYVQFAVARPGLFRAMFAEPCDPDDPARQAAADEIELYLKTLVRRLVPAPDPEAAAVAVWALVHGLAFLHLDGTFAGSTTADMSARVGRVVRVALGPHLTLGGRNTPQCVVSANTSTYAPCKQCTHRSASQGVRSTSTAAAADPGMAPTDARALLYRSI